MKVDAGALEVACRLAREAGARIMERYGSTASETKHGGSPVTAADKEANRLIVAGLRDAFPDDAILAEESADTSARLEHDRVWIVDPLDGTKEFLAGNGEFAVMIGLAVRGEPVLGVVYLPDGDRLYHASAGEGAYLSVGGAPAARLVREPTPKPPRMVASRSHRDQKIERIRSLLGVEVIDRSGSVGVKVGVVAEGRSDLYVHPVPYLCEWDTCAPEIIARESGATVTDCLGEPLRYNKRDPTQPHGILVTAPGLGEPALEAVRSVYLDGSALS